ncbi:unnamed protein product, partial [Peronospora destructor]
MNKPTMNDWKMTKRVARYLKETKTLKLCINSASQQGDSIKIESWSDADFAADKADRKSVSECVLTMDDAMVSYPCKKQTSVSLSTMEAEVVVASHAGRELLGLKELFGELNMKVIEPMSMWMDNQTAINLLKSEKSNSSATHIDIRFMFILHYAQAKVVQPSFVKSEDMIAGLLTKARHGQVVVRLGMHVVVLTNEKYFFAFRRLVQFNISTSTFFHNQGRVLFCYRFRLPKVEECFYRYWYLTDPFPYENPNSGSLRHIRFAVWTLLLNQLVLLLHDIKFLKVKKDSLVDDSDLTYALVLRFGVTVPLYFSAALFMYFLGKAFYARWVKEAEDAKNAALTRDSMVSVGIKYSDADFERKSDVLVEAARLTQDTPRMKVVAEAAQIKYATKERVYDVLINKGGYVRSTQIFSSVVIACHVCCMGILLLAVSTGPKVDAYLKTQKTVPGQPKPVYYMGFLNAVLFAHRSGFRVRFIYATYTTFVVALGIIIAASSISPAHYQQYAGYVSVIFLMGMMISHE